MQAQIIAIPETVRIKPNALARLGIYLRRAGFRRGLLIASEGLPLSITQTVNAALAAEKITATTIVAENNDLEHAFALFTKNPQVGDAVIGLGGGKALDVAKYIAFLAQKPYFAVPTSLSNDGFCSPQASLVIGGKRHSLPATMPYAVIVDTQICLHAPRALWLSGVGDLASKLTAVRDWKWAFHHAGVEVNDFSALLSDATVYQFIARPAHDLDGLRILATALMLNGIAMAVCKSSRPASGAEHLLSHALDAISTPPHLHGLQVGMATYLLTTAIPGMSAEKQLLATMFTQTGFFAEIKRSPFALADWTRAIEMAPTIKQNFASLISLPEIRAALMQALTNDELIRECFA